MRKVKKYDATLELGVPVTLIDAVLEDEDGSVEIPDLDVLLASVAVARALVPVQMVGAELRFLRHVLHLTGAEFADAIDLSNKSVVSRWENDRARAAALRERDALASSVVSRWENDRARAAALKERDALASSVVSRWENDRARPGGYTEKAIRQLVLNLLGGRAPGIDVGKNAIPGMRIHPRDGSEGPLPMSFRLQKRVGSENSSTDCYATAA